jgi:hypothetical protein
MGMMRDHRVYTLLEEYVKLNTEIIKLQEAGIPLQRLKESFSKKRIPTSPIQSKMDWNNELISRTSQEMDRIEEKLRKLLGGG